VCLTNLWLCQRLVLDMVLLLSSILQVTQQLQDTSTYMQKYRTYNSHWTQCTCRAGLCVLSSAMCAVYALSGSVCALCVLCVPSRSTWDPCSPSRGLFWPWSEL
jgi:hypothetical protein